MERKERWQEKEDQNPSNIIPPVSDGFGEKRKQLNENFKNITYTL